MKLYLLDANVLIHANAYYYPLDRIPQFWEWLAAEASTGRIKMPYEIYHEIKGNNPLKEWITKKSIRDALLLDEHVTSYAVNVVLEKGYAPDLNDTEIDGMGKDKFLIAYAAMDNNRVVVTNEVSKPKRKRANRHIPDVCDSLKIKWMTGFELYKELDFRIN